VKRKNIYIIKSC